MATTTVAVVAVVALLGLGWAAGTRLRAAPAGPAVAATTAERATTLPAAPATSGRRGVTNVYRPTTTTALPAARVVPDPLGGALAVSPPASTTVPPTTAAPAPPTSTSTTRAPVTTTTVPPIRRVTGIGDSIMLGAAEPLTEAVRAATGATIEIDARVGRPFAEGVDVADELALADAVGDAVIVHLGTNGPIDDDMVRALLDDVRTARIVVMANVRVPRDWEASVNEVLFRVAASYPNVRLVDWYAATEGRSELFWADGFHLRPEGSEYYAGLLAAALAR